MFQITAHIVAFRLVLVFRVVNEILVSNRLLNFDLYPNSLYSSHFEDGSFEVVSSHPPSVTVDSRQL